VLRVLSTAPGEDRSFCLRGIGGLFVLVDASGAERECAGRGPPGQQYRWSSTAVSEAAGLGATSAAASLPGTVPLVQGGEHVLDQPFGQPRGLRACVMS
jgi:hypothetical protein